MTLIRSRAQLNSLSGLVLEKKRTKTQGKEGLRMDQRTSGRRVTVSLLQQARRAPAPHLSLPLSGKLREVARLTHGLSAASRS